MNLLPKSYQEFNQKKYWNTFFQKRGKKAFEWYGEYPELCGNLHKYIKPKDDILMVGCGNSRLSMDLYDVGCRQIINIDISELVINQMIDFNKKDRPFMQYINMDATDMVFDDNKFSVVLDKGTLDALMVDDSPDVRVTVDKYWSNISRVLRIGGRYICISLLQEHIINGLLEYFTPNKWMFRVVRCNEVEQKTAEQSADGTAMPVFMVIATKFQNLPMSVLEVCMAGDKMQRFQQKSDITSWVMSMQKAALVCNGLHRGSIADLSEVSMDLFRPGDDIARFTIHIIDQKPKRDNGKFAAFIVPQGRETEWLFSTAPGRQKLSSSAKYNRLAIVSMHRGQIYTTWDDVKDELSSSINNLAPNGFKGQIPYLSLGTEVGNRETIYKGHSELSGDYVVEEITGDDGRILRRLIFLSNQFIIQSEALVKNVSNKNSNVTKKSIDPGYLGCNHHLYMSIGVNMVAMCPIKNKEQTSSNIVVIGLGGGGLCTFLHNCLKNVNITAVEIDEAMFHIAKHYFGLTVDDRTMRVVIDDGLAFLRDAAIKGTQYDAILFDVDCKDQKAGLSCPPKEFLEFQILEAVKKCLGDKGIFILNLVCRDETLKSTIITDIKKSFQSVCIFKLEEDINEILYCFNNSQHTDIKSWERRISTAVTCLNDEAKKCKLATDDLIDVSDLLNSLHL